MLFLPPALVSFHNLALPSQTAAQVVSPGVICFAPPPACGLVTGLTSPVCCLGLRMRRSVMPKVSSRGVVYLRNAKKSRKGP